MKTRVQKVNLVLIVGFFIVCPAISQEIGVLGSKYWTDNSELQNPLGFGAYLSKDISELFSVKLSYEYLSNERVYDGTTSNGLIGENTVQERIKSNSHANLWKLHFSVSPIRFELLRFYTGIVLSNNFFNAERHGQQTGRNVPLHNGQKFGIGLFFNIQMLPLETIPILITVNASKEYLGTSSMATDVDLPFAKKMTTTNLQLCLGYILK